MEVYDEGNVGRWGCSSRLRNAVRLYVEYGEVFFYLSLELLHVSNPLSCNIDIDSQFVSRFTMYFQLVYSINGKEHSLHINVLDRFAKSCRTLIGWRREPKLVSLVPCRRLVSLSAAD